MRTSPRLRTRPLVIGAGGFMLVTAMFALALPLAVRPSPREMTPTQRRVTASSAATRALAAVPAELPKPKPQPKPQPAPKKPAAPKPAKLDAYQGLGAWVDIFDERAWGDPSSAVRDMKRRGVRTIFIETANSRSPSALRDPAALGTFIRVAHAEKMKVVAWYLADMKDIRYDYGRIAEAIRFRTKEGQAFDSFALDIESGAVASVAARNRALGTLSRDIRGLVGPDYPLGAIIPSPVGLSKPGNYWPGFPYKDLARTYDVFVPMAYYTYHGDGNTAAYADALANVRILRAQPGCAKTPIHLIGGVAEKSSPSEVRAFARASRETGCFGFSLYAWEEMNAAHWEQLVRP